MPDYEFKSPRADSDQLQRIKSNFQVSDNEKAEEFDNREYLRRNPVVTESGIISVDGKFSESSIQGLSYPLALDGNGGLSVSSNYTRLSEQILEALETRIGERVYRQFFGIPELIFETISEDLVSKTIKTQLESILPFDIELDVSVKISEEGTSTVFIKYSIEGAGSYIVTHSLTNAANP
ncbi:virion structural protein [Cyanophage S-TIM54]|nr:virion structural protein [Cyanophage S-TIM54]